METVFINKLKSFLDAVARQMTLYVPKKIEQHYIYRRYEPSGEIPVEFNNIRTCTTVKDFLFPVCELAAVFPESVEPEDIKPFAVFGLKDCDLRSIEILDKVFLEPDFLDPLYKKRRENMFVISSDCSPVLSCPPPRLASGDAGAGESKNGGESCFCNLVGGQPFAQKGFDLNVSKVKDGFIIEAGSQKGQDFIGKHPQLFADVPDVLLAERDESRALAQKQLEQNNAEYEFDMPLKQIMEDSQDSEVFDIEAKNCVECQGCTRVCPTCHCFYLYDTKQKDYFAKMKMWDSCIRRAYAEVAGGANPRKILGDRLKHRLMHKFVYFLDRYGIDMCVGCGRCVDACAGGIDMRAVFKKLNEELKAKDKKQAKVAK